MTQDQLLLDIARDLNDAEPGHEFQTWASAQLLVWFNEGLCTAFSLKPSAFTSTKVIKLEVGTDQTVCDCTILHKILGQTNAEGTITTPLLRNDESMSLRWTKAACPAPVGDGSGGTKLTSYTFDPMEGGAFRVQPPVPPGAEVYLKVVCYGSPDALVPGGKATLSDCSTTTAAKQWVLFRALMVDDESATAMAAAVIHRDLFFQLLNLQVTSELLHTLGADNYSTLMKGRRK